MSEGVFETVSTPRLRAFFGSLFGASQSSTDVDGACDSQCADLCPTTCFGSSKTDGSKCMCEDFKCSGNAVCSSSDKCECKLGFNGNGVTCCDSKSGLTLSGSVCVVGSQPTGPMAPSAPVPAVPVGAVPTVGPPVPTRPPVPTAPRAPSSGRDVVRPKLLDFVALSPLIVDVSAGTGKMEFQVTAQDDQSGLKSILVYAYTEPRQVLYNKTFDTPALGKVFHSVSMPFSKFVSAGSAFLTVGLEDFAGNQFDAELEELSEKGFPYDLEVVNTKNDTAPPELLELKPLTPLAVNVTGLNATLEFRVVVQATVQDDFSGMFYMNARWVSRFGGQIQGSFEWYSDRKYRYDSFPLAGQPVLANLTVSLNVDRFSTANVYALESIQLQDRAGKLTVYNATTLAAKMMQFNITIVK